MIFFFRIFNQTLVLTEFRRTCSYNYIRRFIRRRLPSSKNHLCKLFLLKSLIIYSCSLICDFAAFALYSYVRPNLFRFLKKDCVSLWLRKKPSKIVCNLPDLKSFVIFPIQIFSLTHSSFFLLDGIYFCFLFLLSIPIYPISISEPVPLGQCYIVHHVTMFRPYLI